MTGANRCHGCALGSHYPHTCGLESPEPEQGECQGCALGSHYPHTCGLESPEPEQGEDRHQRPSTALVGFNYDKLKSRVDEIGTLETRLVAYLDERLNRIEEGLADQLRKAVESARVQEHLVIPKLLKDVNEFVLRQMQEIREQVASLKSESDRIRQRLDNLREEERRLQAQLAQIEGKK